MKTRIYVDGPEKNFLELEIFRADSMYLLEMLENFGVTVGTAVFSRVGMNIPADGQR